MKFLNKIFNNKEFTIKGYKLKYMKLDNTWHVLKGHVIMFVGDEQVCRNYINQL